MMIGLGQISTPLLDELDAAGFCWPSFIIAGPPEDHDQGETGTGDTGE